MTCPQRVTEALATLPWVEPDSILADRNTRQVRFTVRDRTRFDFEAMQDAIRNAGYYGTKLLVAPTET